MTVIIRHPVMASLSPRDTRWSAGKSLAFIVSAGTIGWAFIIGLVALVA